MKRYLLIISTILLGAAACQQEAPVVQGDKLAFAKDHMAVQIGKYYQLTAYGVSGKDSVEVESTRIQWTTSDPKIATITSGILLTTAKGEAVISASYGDKSASIRIISRDGETSTGIDGSFSADQIYDLGRQLAASSGMQQFDIDKDGSIYYFQVGVNPAFYETLVTKVRPSKTGSSDNEGWMRLWYQGHPTGCSVEDAEDGTYLWVPEFSGKYTSATHQYYKQYWNAQTVARIKWEPGKSVFPGDPQVEHFWFGHSGDINVAIDQANDILCVTYHNSKHLGQTRRVFTYSLSEAMKTPLEDITLKEYVRGGDGAPDISEETVAPTIKAHDMTKVKPLAEMGISTVISKPEDVNYYAWQGFDYDNGLVYFVEGTAGSIMGGSVCALTVFDMTGAIYEKRAYVRLLSEPAALKGFGITTTGGMESEGVKAWNGNLYLGFASTGYQGQTSPRANVFKYNLASK